jgi:predicted lipase
MKSARLKAAAALCRASYVDADERFKTVDELRFGLVEQDGVAWLTFRGTANLRGWLDDFTVIPALTMFGHLAHAGFIQAAAKLWEPARQALVNRTATQIIITGHSLGAAIALLFAEALRSTVITFGCPRVYSAMEHNPPAMEHYRIIVADDPVPMVPDPIAWQHLCDPFLTLPGDGDGLPDKADHDIDYYIARLAAQDNG